MPHAKTALIVALAAGLAACATATPYQPLVPDRGGYSEQRLAANRYRVAFAGNPHTAPEQLEAHLLRRAAELALEQGYEWFSVSGQRMEGEVQTIQTRWGPMRVSRGPGAQGWRNYGSFYVRPGLKLLNPIWRRIGRGTGDALEASAEVTFGRGPRPQGDDVFDARQVLRQRGR